MVNIWIFLLKYSSFFNQTLHELGYCLLGILFYCFLHVKTEFDLKQIELKEYISNYRCFVFCERRSLGIYVFYFLF